MGAMGASPHCTVLTAMLGSWFWLSSSVEPCARVILLPPPRTWIAPPPAVLTVSLSPYRLKLDAKVDVTELFFARSRLFVPLTLTPTPAPDTDSQSSPLITAR